MSHGILLNKYTPEINIAAIDEDFDIYRISDGSENFSKNAILDLVKADNKVLAVQYTYGKVAFVLFRKGEVSLSGFRETVQEKYRYICVQKVDITDEETRNDLYLYDSTLIQLLVNSVHVPENTLFSYSNITGKLYYISHKWKFRNRFYCIEIQLRKENAIILSVRSFRRKLNNEEGAVYVFDPKTGDLRKKLPTDKGLDEFVFRGIKNKRNTVSFLRYESSDQFYNSKLGILERFMSDISDRFSKYFTITLMENEDSFVFGIEKKSKKKKVYTSYGKLLNNEINIVDEVCTEDSQRLKNKLAAELESFYKINVTSGGLCEEKCNIRIIHEPEYYEKNKILDVHNEIPKGAVVQHMMIEQTDHLNKNTLKDKPSPDIRKTVQELIIKGDIKQNRISVFDRAQWKYDEDVVFVIRERIKSENDEDKKKKDYIYKILRITPSVETAFNSFDTRNILNEKEEDILGLYESFCSRYGKYPNELEGIVLIGEDKFFAIVRTIYTTMPNFKAIAEGLRQKSFSKKTLLDAVSAFIEDTPEYADYGRAVLEKLSERSEISYKFANSCLNFRTYKKEAPALNRYIYLNFGIRINPEIKAQANEEEYYMGNFCDIRYFYETLDDGSKVLSYYVGTKRGDLKFSVHNACAIRRIYSDDELPDPEKLFPLMTAEFVRNEQYTVLPFPFKYLREYHLT